MATLPEMSNEILLEISSCLDYPDLNAFAQVSRHFHALSNRELYRDVAKDSSGKAIAWAARNGNEASAQKLLQMCGSKIMDDFVEDQEPILIAASNGHAHIVELFLPYCIQHDTEKEDDLFKRSLAVAIRKDHVAVVKLLLGHKAIFKTNRRVGDAVTLLCMAVELGNVSIVKLFLEHNYCDLNTDGHSGITPLALAAATRASSTNLEITQLLIEAGADLYKDPNLLLRAASSGNMPVVKLFLANNLSGQQLNWLHVLDEFAQPKRENHEMGALLLSWMDVDRILEINSFHRYDVMRGAIINRLDDLLERILDEWPVLNEDYQPNRPSSRLCHLSLAVCFGRPRAVKLLLEHGANANGEGDCRPVQFALERGKDTIARLLFENGATFDAEKCRGVAEYRQLLKLRMARVQRRVQRRPVDHVQ